MRKEIPIGGRNVKLDPGQPGKSCKDERNIGGIGRIW